MALIFFPKLGPAERPVIHLFDAWRKACIGGSADKSFGAARPLEAVLRKFVVRKRCSRAWCGRRDSNPHNFRHWNLNPARLPVPPRPQAASCPAAMPRAAGV